MVKYLFLLSLVACLLLLPGAGLAMAPGTLLYRTGSNGQMFGYQGELMETTGGIITAVNAGHVAMYIGKIDGEDYVVEAAAGGIVKTPAKYFLNRGDNEVFLGAKLPKGLDPIRQAKAVAIAKSLADGGLAYDFDFHRQKGARSGDWTCVGLTEKIYESADISNPHNIGALEYDRRYYAIDITPDGYDDYSPADRSGDRFSRDKEFSQIARRTELLFPLPEKIGYNAGLEKDGQRYMFLPYTQFLQPTLETVPTDIVIHTSDDGYAEARGKTNWLAIGLRWSLINNPISSVKNLVNQVGESVAVVKDLIFGGQSGTGIVLQEESVAAVKNQAVTPSPVVVKKNDVEVKLPEQEVPFEKKPVQEIITKEQASPAPPLKVTVKPNAPSELPTSASESKTAPILKASSPAPISVYDPKRAASSTVKISSATSSLEVPVYVSDNPAAQMAADAPKIAKISGLYSSGANDWVELYNPTDFDFDLAAAGYRIEKTKSAEDPSIVMRIGNQQDGSYPGGTLIRAKGKYLIVSSGAGDYYKSRAQAIGTRTDFSWPGSGQTIYLGVGAISSSGDEDIVDALGFGPDARFFQGSAPAPKIMDNYVLARQAYNSDNAGDYALVKSSDPAIVWTPEALPEDEEENEDLPVNEEEEPEPVTPRIIIKRVYSTGNNDWVELYNPNNFAVDLAHFNYRLEKSRTADDPALIIRIGHELDASYPGGTVVGPGESYKIVRAAASAYHLDQADAIALRTDYLWSGAGYSLYLGKGPISSSQDEDIVDVLGFGTEARYYLGSAPAPAISDGHLLSRRSDTQDNSVDFELLPGDDPALTLPEEEEVPADPGRYVFPAPIVSPGLVNIWHFDDCYNFATRTVGRFDCGVDMAVVSDLAYGLEPPPDADQLSIGFYYKRNSSYPRLRLNISDAESFSLSLILEMGLITLENFPNSSFRYNRDFPFDYEWHQAVVVIDKDNGYWALYIDGSEVVRENFMVNLPAVDKIHFNSEHSSIFVDEVAVWHRSLSEEEIMNNFLLNAPYYPLAERSPQKEPALVYYWQFEEEVGEEAVDEVSSQVMTFNPSQRAGRMSDNYAVATALNQIIKAPLYIPLDERDFSVAFWWRNSSYPQEGRADIMFLSDFEERKGILGLEVNYYRNGYYFNEGYGIIAQGDEAALPSDGDWHHVAFVYDSYRYRLSLYVDGEEAAFSHHVWLPDHLVIGGLEISTRYYEALLDDFRIYKGALNREDIQEIYNNTR